MSNKIEIDADEFCCHLDNIRMAFIHNDKQSFTTGLASLRTLEGYIPSKPKEIVFDKDWEKENHDSAHNPI